MHRTESKWKELATEDGEMVTTRNISIVPSPRGGYLLQIDITGECKPTGLYYRDGERWYFGKVIADKGHSVQVWRRQLQGRFSTDQVFYQCGEELQLAVETGLEAIMKLYVEAGAKRFEIRQICERQGPDSHASDRASSVAERNGWRVGVELVGCASDFEPVEPSLAAMEYKLKEDQIDKQTLQQLLEDGEDALPM